MASFIETDPKKIIDKVLSHRKYLQRLKKILGINIKSFVQKRAIVLYLRKIMKRKMSQKMFRTYMKSQDCAVNGNIVT